MGAHQIHIAQHHFRRVVFHNGHDGILQPLASVQTPDVVDDGSAVRIVHHAVQLAPGKVSAALAAGEFVGGILPHFSQQQSIGLDLVNPLAQQPDEFIRQLVGHIQPVAVGTQPEPVGHHAVLVPDDIIQEGWLHFVHCGQGIKIPPAVVAAGPGVEGVPAAVGRLLGVVSAAAVKMSLPVKVQAVRTGVGEYPIQNHPDAPVVGSLAHGGKILLGAQHGVGGFVITGVVAVRRKALGNGVQIQNGGAQTGDIVHFFCDAPEIAAVEIVVQDNALAGGLPVDIFVPVLVDGVRLQLAG